MRVLVVERRAVEGQDLWADMPLPIPFEELDVGPDLARARKNGDRRAIADDHLSGLELWWPNPQSARLGGRNGAGL
jgi:hypothetical protein